MDDGEIVTYALGKLDDRGRMFVRARAPGRPALRYSSVARTTTEAPTHEPGPAAVA